MKGRFLVIASRPSFGTEIYGGAGGRSLVPPLNGLTYASVGRSNRISLFGMRSVRARLFEERSDRFGWLVVYCHGVMFPE